MKYFLIGFMGSGKSTVGKKLASHLNIPFIDLDSLIAEREGMSITEIFKTKGEEYFRSAEKKQLTELCVSKEDFVIATGGGTPCYFNNMTLILNHGISIYLQANSAILYSRLSRSKAKRPLIMGLSDDELKNYIEKKLLERESFYLQANIHISGLSVDIKELVSLLAPYSK